MRVRRWLWRLARRWFGPIPEEEQTRAERLALQVEGLEEQVKLWRDMAQHLEDESIVKGCQGRCSIVGDLRIQLHNAIRAGQRPRRRA